MFGNRLQSYVKFFTFANIIKNIFLESKNSHVLIFIIVNK